VTPPIDMPVTAAARPDPGNRPYAPWRMLAAIDLHGCDRGRRANLDAVIAVEHFGGTPTVTVLEQ
jgi:hypothetical protein